MGFLRGLHHHGGLAESPVFLYGNLSTRQSAKPELKR